MFSSLDVSTSALVAQRGRLNAISSNIANISTTRNERGEAEPYQPRYVTFQTDSSVATPGGGNGVKISSVQYSTAPPNMKYEPGHPDADSRGFVRYPAVNMTEEFVDALEASRSYEANVGVIEVS
jgi:flagellar basal-body rod protein FlgC